MMSLMYWLLLTPALIAAWVLLCIAFAKLFGWFFARRLPVTPRSLHDDHAGAKRLRDVTFGLSPVLAEDLSNFVVTKADGIWSGRMPERLELNLPGRYGDPVRYKRADVIDRIEARYESRRGYYYIESGEVPSELVHLAEKAFGSPKAAVSWFGNHVAEIGMTPQEFLQRDGDPGQLKALLNWMAG